MNFENVMNTLYELTKSMNTKELESHLSSLTSYYVGTRVHMFDKVIHALMEFKEEVDE